MHNGRSGASECINEFIYTHIHTHKRTHMLTCTHAHMHIHMHIHAHTDSRTHMSTHEQTHYKLLTSGFNCLSFYIDSAVVCMFCDQNANYAFCLGWYYIISLTPITMVCASFYIHQLFYLFWFYDSCERSTSLP